MNKSAISSYSRDENSKALNKMRPLRSEVDFKLDRLKFIKELPLVFNIPQQSMSRFRNELNRNNFLYVNSNQFFSLELEARSKQLVCIYLKNKVVPLRVKIEKVYGQLEIFMSQRTKTPSKYYHERKETKDQFLIEENRFNFRIETMYINIYSVKHSKFVIYFAFGKSSFTNKHKDPSSEQQDMGLDSLDRKIKLQSQSKTVNKSVSLPKCAYQHKLKVQSLDLQKKKFDDFLKVTKEKEARIKNVFIKNWLVLICRVRAIVQIRNIIHKSKANKLIGIVFTIGIISLQKKIRKRMQGGIHQRIQTLGMINLKFYSGSILKLQIERSRVKIADFMHNQIGNVMAQSAFTSFICKIKTIQSMWRIYKFRMEELWIELIKMWDTQVYKFSLIQLCDSKKKKEQKRFNLSKLNDANMEIGLREFIKNRKAQIFIQIQEFNKFRKSENYTPLRGCIDKWLRFTPKLRLMPTKKEMLRIINTFISK